MPQLWGTTTPSTAFVAIAASTAEPPARRTPRPAAVARWCGATTAPRVPRASGTGDQRPSVGHADGRPEAGSGRWAVPTACSSPRRSWASGTSATSSRITVAMSMPSIPRAVGGDPADQRADDLPDREEDRVQAHDRAAVAAGTARRCRRAGPSAAGVAPASTNSPNAATPAATIGTINGRPVEWLTTMPAATSASAAEDAVQDDRRPAQVLEPVAPVERARRRRRRR